LRDGQKPVTLGHAAETAPPRNGPGAFIAAELIRSLTYGKMIELASEFRRAAGAEKEESHR